MTMSQRHRRALEDQRTAWSQFQEIQARRSAVGYTPTDEDGEAATRALDEIERQGAIAAEEERAAKLEAALTAPAPDQRSTNPVGEQPTEDQNAETYRAGFDTFMRRGMSACTGEQRSLLERGLVHQSDEMRALGASVGSAGGYTVPPGFLARLIEVLKAFGGIFEEAEVLTTSGGNDIQWPTTDDTTEVGAIFGENSQITELDATFGTASIKAYTYTSRIVRIAIQLLQDSGIDMEAHVAARLGRRIARALAAHLATGSGTNQPQGLVTGLASGFTTKTAGKIEYNDLIELEHSINSAYRTAAKYLLQDSSLREVRKLQDSTGRPLWAPALSASVPATINGRPYAIVDDLPAFATGAVGPIVYGDIKQAYLVRQVNGAQVMRLTERYADYLQVGFLSFQRFDGRVQNAAAAKVLTVR